MTQKPSNNRRNRFGITISILAALVILSIVVFYATGPTSSSMSKYIVAKTVTVHGKAAGFPCAALQLPCPLYTDKSSTQANLMQYNGKYYYNSNMTANGVVYSVWYDNSTYYCVSPRFQSEKSCPP